MLDNAIELSNVTEEKISRDVVVSTLEPLLIATYVDEESTIAANVVLKLVSINLSITNELEYGLNVKQFEGTDGAVDYITTVTSSESVHRITVSSMHDDADNKFFRLEDEDLTVEVDDDVKAKIAKMSIPPLADDVSGYVFNFKGGRTVFVAVGTE